MTLTRDQVEDTALAILTRFGLADLSMRRLARELDVQVGALYWHVKSKQELLVGVAARLLSGLDGPDGLAGPDDAGRPGPSAPQDASPAGGRRAERRDHAAGRAGVAGLATGIRSALVNVPDSAEVVQVAQSLQPDALKPLNRLRSLLESAGVAHPAWAQHLVMNHVLGSIAAAQEAARLAAVDPTASATPLGEDAFQWGLQVILDGLFGTAPVAARP
ncbi:MULTISPECIES: TetR/AcrR family transcriptional regulator [Micrococcaceae]|uniref:TetR/AcrR family transcriptional regulator n=1 Tax=Micrococcaceae TaxID=1268 RepID=UPI00161DD69C|nr:MULTISPECIES: TetR family transcriptional regulator [Micrococcaceae]MBB5750427.1 AcrR family transcriptional regulator [Micrococcus sp. TA1]HRO29720.1 TetR family transcriptional regulator [Citricoccus sp.]HRO93787.1 TetR family transcriptional regulator [Citricoccus sp.]